MAEKALRGELERAEAILSRAAEARPRELALREVGTVRSIARGIARISGLPGLASEELVEFTGGVAGFAFNLDPDEVGIILLGEGRGIRAGDEVRRTGRVTDVPVGPAMLGRVIDPTGAPRDGRGPIRSGLRFRRERPHAPGDAGEQLPAHGLHRRRRSTRQANPP